MKRTLRFFAVLTLFFVISSTIAPVAFAQAGKADYYLGLDLYHEKDYEGSARAFQQQLSKTPEDVSAQRWYSKALERTRLAREEQITPKAAQPTDSAPIFNSEYDRGVWLYRNNQFAQAQLAFEKHLKSNPKHVPSRQWLALLDAHRPTVDPKTLLDRPIAKDIASKSAAPLHPAPPIALLPGGNPQFGMEQKVVLPVAPPPALTPLSFGEKLKSIGIGKPKAVPQPAVTPTQAPAPLSPVIASSATASPSATTAAEIEKLRQELNLRNEQIRRAIVQTKRAIAQTDEAETLNIKLGKEVETLRKQEAELSAELDKKKSDLALLENVRAKTPSAPVKTTIKDSARQAETEMNLRKEIAQLVTAKNNALASQKLATQKLDAAAKAKDDTARSATDALAKKEAELLKLRQDASAAQRQFDIRFGQLQRTLENAQANALSLENQKHELNTRLASIETERAASVKKSETETGASKLAFQNRIEEFAKLNNELRTKLDQTTSVAAENEKLLKQAVHERQALENAKTSLEQEINRRNEQIHLATEETRIATAITARREKEFAESASKLKASSEDLKRSAIQLEKAAIEKNRLQSAIAELESEKTNLAAMLQAKETALQLSERGIAEATSHIKEDLKLSETKQKQIADQLRSTEQNLARVAISYQTSEDARLDAERRAVQNAKRGKDVAMRLIAKEKELSSALATEEALRRTLAGFEERLASGEDDRAALEAARLAANARAQDTQSQAADLQTQIRSLYKERESLIAHTQRSEADLAESHAQLSTARAEIESIRRQSQETTAALEAELGASARKLDLASQARRLSEERAETAQKQFENATQALKKSENTLALTNQKYQETQEARTQLEQQLTQAYENAQSLAGQLQMLRESESKMLSQIRDRERTLEMLQADVAKRTGELQDRAAQSETALRQVSTRYQESEQSRLAAETRLGEIARERNGIESELLGLRTRVTKLQSDIESRDLAYRESRAELAAISEDASRERAETSSQLSHLQKIIEESRAQGILLAGHLEQERSLRKRLETRFAKAEASDAQTRNHIKNLRNQLNRTLPQLQAMNTSLDEISVTTVISEGAFDE